MVELENILSDNNEQKAVVTCGDKTQEITVKRCISFDEFVEAVERIAGNCVDKESGEAEFSVFDFMRRVVLVEYYTDVKLPDSADVAYRLVYETDICDVIAEHGNMEQINEIELAAKEDIRFRFSKVNSTSVMLSKAMDGASEVFKGFGDKLGGIDIEDVRSFLDLFKDGIDQEKIADVILKSLKENGGAE